MSFSLKKLSANELLFIEGDLGDEMYLIKSGSVKILKREGSKSVHLATLGPGSMLGEMSILDNSPRSATAKTTEDTEVAVISKSTFDEACTQLPPWLLSLLRIMVSRLRSTNEKKFAEDQKTAVACAAGLIAEWAEGFWPEALPNNLLTFEILSEKVQAIQGVNAADVRKQLRKLVDLKLFEIGKDAQNHEFIVDPQAHLLKEFSLWCAKVPASKEILSQRETQFSSFKV